MLTPLTLSTNSCWMGSEAAAAATYDVARFLLRETLTKEATRRPEDTDSMISEVERG
jgi:hypothetical protein